jgi:SAM-dependent methyltransferase
MDAPNAIPAERRRKAATCPLCLGSSTLPVLSGTDYLFETTTQTFKLSACSGCYCFFLDPMPSPEQIANFYPQQYWWKGSGERSLKRFESIYRRLVLRDHISFVKRAARNIQPQPAEVKLLDVGCGTGTLISILKDRGFRVLGLDFSPEASKVAALEHGVKVIVGSLEDAKFPDRSFDMITLFHVMEHLTEPLEMLQEVNRILMPGGRVVIQVPNIDSWQRKIFGPYWYGLDIPRHVIDYSPSSMIKLLQKTGFEPSRVRHFNLRDNAPALVSSLFTSLDPVSRAVRQQKYNISETPAVAWSRHLSYMFFVLCAYPITILESISGHGATIMIEARKI